MDEVNFVSSFNRDIYFISLKTQRIKLRNLECRIIFLDGVEKLACS